MIVTISTNPNGSYVVLLGSEWTLVGKQITTNKARATLATFIEVDRCELECSGYSIDEGITGESVITVKFIDRISDVQH